MGKKKKDSKVSKKDRVLRAASNTNKSSKALYLITGILFVGLAGAIYLFTGTGNRGAYLDYDSIKDVSELRGGETRPILPSYLFFGVATKAYKVAREIPDVLDSIYCYCGCISSSGHKSLKSCFTDKHGANCGICVDQALRTYELYKEGKDILTIRKTIDREFA